MEMCVKCALIIVGTIIVISSAFTGEAAVGYEPQRTHSESRTGSKRGYEGGRQDGGRRGTPGLSRTSNEALERIQTGESKVQYIQAGESKVQSIQSDQSKAHYFAVNKVPQKEIVEIEPPVLKLNTDNNTTPFMPQNERRYIPGSKPYTKPKQPKQYQDKGRHTFIKLFI